MTETNEPPWIGDHFRALRAWLYARHSNVPAEQMNQELAAILAEGDRRRAEKGQSNAMKNKTPGHKKNARVIGPILAGVPAFVLAAAVLMTAISQLL